MSYVTQNCGFSPCFSFAAWWWFFASSALLAKWFFTASALVLYCFRSGYALLPPQSTVVLHSALLHRSGSALLPQWFCTASAVVLHCFPRCSSLLPHCFRTDVLSAANPPLAETTVFFFFASSVPCGLFKHIWCFFVCVFLCRPGPRSCVFFHAKMRGTRRTAKSDGSKAPPASPFFGMVMPRNAPP